MGILVIDKVVKQFEGHKALDNVSIDIPEGCIFGLLGPNGAGKTTLLRIINQITAPDSGTVLLNGHQLRPDDILNIGYLPEERGLYRKMKVGEQALYLARLKGMKQEDAMKSLKQWFVKFGIQSWWNRKVNELSKGMAQKVQFITTVIHHPRLLILDEPFSGFDPVNVDIIRNEILEMKKNGVTIILSTHNMESVEEMCDNIALINKSKLILTGKVNEVRRQHGDNRIEILYRSEKAIELPSSSSFSIVSQVCEEDCYRVVVQRESNIDSNTVIRTMMDQGANISEVKEIIPSMRDIFIKLVKE